MCKRDRPEAAGLMRVRGLEAPVPPPQLAHRMSPGSSRAGISSPASRLATPWNLRMEGLASLISVGQSSPNKCAFE